VWTGRRRMLSKQGMGGRRMRKQGAPLGVCLTVNYLKGFKGLKGIKGILLQSRALRVH
jgi:hypothetical protein